MDNKSEQQAPTLDLTTAQYPNLSALVHGLMSGRISEWPLLKIEASRIQEENRILRELLFVAHGAGYGDDGELQNNQCQPYIDFRRDTAMEIKAKIITRNANYAGRCHTGPISQELIDAYHAAFNDDRNRQQLQVVKKR